MSQVSVRPLQRQVSPTMAVIPAILVQAELLVVIAALSSLPHRSHVVVFINFLKGKVTTRLTGQRGHSQALLRRAQGAGVLFVFNGD